MEGEVRVSRSGDAAGRSGHRDGQPIRRRAGELGNVVGDPASVRVADIVQDALEQTSNRFHGSTISLREREPSRTGSLSG